MADQGTQDPITVYVDEETELILGMLQSTIADEMLAAIESADLPDRLEVKYGADLLKESIEHLETKVIRTLEARINVLAEESQNTRSELVACVAAVDGSDAKFRDLIWQSTQELHEQIGNPVEQLKAEMAAARTALAEVRDEMKAFCSDLSELSDDMERLVATVDEVAMSRDTLSRVPGFIVWLLGERTTLKLMKESCARLSPKEEREHGCR